MTMGALTVVMICLQFLYKFGGLLSSKSGLYTAGFDQHSG